MFLAAEFAPREPRPGLTRASRIGYGSNLAPLRAGQLDACAQPWERRTVEIKGRAITALRLEFIGVGTWSSSVIRPLIYAVPPCLRS